MKSIKLPLAKQHLTAKVVVVAVLVLAMAGAGLALYFHQRAATPSKIASTETPEPGYHQTEDELRDYTQQVDVQITADGFSPQTLRITKATRINWINKDTVAHHIVIAPGTKVPPQFYDNRQVAVDGGYPFVVHQTGTFQYYDSASPTHTGIVIVK